MISILYNVRVSWFHDSMDCRHKQGPLSHRLHSPTTMKIHFEATSCIIQRIHTIHTIHTHTIHIRMTARWQNHRTTGPQDHRTTSTQSDQHRSSHLVRETNNKGTNSRTNIPKEGRKEARKHTTQDAEYGRNHTNLYGSMNEPYYAKRKQNGNNEPYWVAEKTCANCMQYVCVMRVTA